jgi:hypothetical protein
MKRRYMVPVAAVAVFGLMAAFATVAQAFPTKTNACTNCHSGVNVPVTATAGAASGTTVAYALAAPSATAIAVFDGATKVGTYGSTGSFSATVGKTYTAYAVTGPTTGDGLGSTTFTVAAPVVVPPVVTPAVPAAPVLNATYNSSTGSVIISWVGVTGATSYDYQVGSGAMVSTTNTSVTLTGLAVGNTAFKLRATNTGGSSAYSAATVVYTAPVVVPPVVVPPVVVPPVVTPPVVTPPVVVPPAVTPTPTPTPAPNLAPARTGYKVKRHIHVNRKLARKLTATLTDKVTGARFIAKLDRKGNVAFNNVPAGTYRLTVTGSRQVKYKAKTIVVGTPVASQNNN